jgi:hypothetical protein
VEGAAGVNRGGVISVFPGPAQSTFRPVCPDKAKPFPLAVDGRKIGRRRQMAIRLKDPAG